MNRSLRLALYALAVSIFTTTTAAFAAPVAFNVVLDGPSEPTASLGTGTGTITFDTTAHTMRVQVTFAGLTGNTTASHIHSPTAVPFTGTANVATQTPTFTGFPLTVKSGTYDHTFDMTLTSSYNSPFVTANGGTAAGAETALFN